MSHIVKIAKGLSYYPTSDLKADGKPVMALDIRKTRINMIPEKLKGVDRVIVRQDQLKYIAPDYKGQVYIREDFVTAGKRSFREYPMDNISILKMAYQERKDISPFIFDQSYLASQICSAWGSDEIHLPAKLYFFWNLQEYVGNLNAGHTWLQERPVIENVPNVVMPNTDKLARRYHHEAKQNKRIARRNRYADHLYIMGRNYAFSR